MASFRSSIKIISDVSKLPGRILLQRSISAEHLLVHKGMHSAAVQRSSSRSGLNASEEEHVTDVVVAEKSWFSTFNDRQNKEPQAPRPKRKVAMQQEHDAVTSKNKFLVPPTGPQLPNRYFSTDYCTRDPPAPFKGPPPSERDCHKNTAKPCFMDTFQKKVVEEKIQPTSRVSCSAKAERAGNFCETKAAVKAFSVCPKPVQREALFRCPLPPKIGLPPKKRVIDKCEQRKPPPYKVCPKPPSRKRPPMCASMNPKTQEEKKPKPPPTPRRCVCADDPENVDMFKSAPLYKMNPDIPFPVCPKKKYAVREPYKWPSTNKVCPGESKTCRQGCDGSDSKTMTKTAACKSIRGEPCVEAHACPYHPAPNRPPPAAPCGPVSRPAFPTGAQESFAPASATASAPKSTPSAPKQFPSSTSAPKKVQSMASVTKQVSSSKSAPRSLSASASAPRSASPITSLPKKNVLAATTSKAVSQSSMKSSKSSETAMAFNQSTKLDCKKMAFNNKNDKKQSGGKCEKFRLPGCRVPKRTDCGTRKRKRKVCVKKPVPTPCFTDCYKGPCPFKICNPCPCVHVAPITECDIKFKTRHLQPKEPIFVEKRPFVLPPPTVELFVDPSIGACCESTKTPAPPPIPCPKKPVAPSVPAPVPKKQGEKKGCDCSIVNFLRGLMSFLKGNEKCPVPPDEVKKVALNADPLPGEHVCDTIARNRETQYKTASTELDDSCRESDPKSLAKNEKTTSSSSGPCPKFTLPGCKARVRQDCSIVNPDSVCKKRLAPRPSFSECVKNDFPSIKCTECRIALKRAKSLSELRDKGLRVTAENLRVHCSMCLNPTTRGCESTTKKLDCFKLSHSCKTNSCNRMALASPKSEKPATATSNPPRPTRDYSGPRVEAKKCEKPPAGVKKDCKNMPKGKEDSKPKTLPCNTEDEKPANNPNCDDLDGEICEAPEPYRMPKEDTKKN